MQLLTNQVLNKRVTVLYSFSDSFLISDIVSTKKQVIISVRINLIISELINGWFDNKIDIKYQQFFLTFFVLYSFLTLTTTSVFSGSTITAEIQGVIDACVKLTGMPDLTLSFMVSFLFLFLLF